MAVFRQKERMEELQAAVPADSEEADWLSSVERLAAAWKETEERSRLVKLCGKLCESFCASSMVVFSGGENTDFPIYEQMTPEGEWSFQARISASCLYLGDIQLSEDEGREALQQEFGDCLPRMSTMTLPGHGELNLYHRDIVQDRGIVVAFADSENITGAPHSAVIRNIMQQEIPFYLVTELPGSTARFYVKEDK